MWRCEFSPGGFARGGLTAKPHMALHDVDTGSCPGSTGGTGWLAIPSAIDWSWSVSVRPAVLVTAATCLAILLLFCGLVTLSHAQSGGLPSNKELETRPKEKDPVAGPKAETKEAAPKGTIQPVFIASKKRIWLFKRNID